MNCFYFNDALFTVLLSLTMQLCSWDFWQTEAAQETKDEKYNRFKMRRQATLIQSAKKKKNTRQLTAASTRPKSERPVRGRPADAERQSLNRRSSEITTFASPTGAIGGYASRASRESAGRNQRDAVAETYF